MIKPRLKLQFIETNYTLRSNGHWAYSDKAYMGVLLKEASIQIDVIDYPANYSQNLDIWSDSGTWPTEITSIYDLDFSWLYAK